MNGMYAQYTFKKKWYYQRWHVLKCQIHSLNHKDCASSFVNPLTALGMVETCMKIEDHRDTALIHTAAASNLGQMLVKICLADNIPLINIVRKPEQVIY